MSQIKTVVVSINIAKHDLDRKMRQAQEFLIDGERVRINLGKLRGREKNRAYQASEALNSYFEEYLRAFGMRTSKATESSLTFVVNPRP